MKYFQSYSQNLQQNHFKVQIWDCLFAKTLLKIMAEKYGLKIIKMGKETQELFFGLI
jgi:hypothetical protein